MRQLLDLVLAEAKPGPLQDGVLQGLRHLVPDTLIIGAFTLIDSNRISLYVSENGRRHYLVEGSGSSLYTVYPDLEASALPLCTCYAFLHGVLASQNYLLCKHILAVKLATRMDRITEQPILEDNLANLISLQMRS